MKNILFLLFILVIIGILWLGSGFWNFSKDMYINSETLGKTVIFNNQLDLEYLEKEFKPAYEF